jgi:predicted negative regulator of RcsB-dependent stress response
MTAPSTPKATASKFRMDEDSLVAFARENGTRLSIAAAVLALLVAGGWLYVSSARRKEAFASEQLLQARSSAEAGNLPLAASDLTKLVVQFSGTKAADAANVLLDQIRLLQGQRDVAINDLQKFVQGSHDTYSKASAYSLLGGGLEDQNKPRDAAQAYKLASDFASLDFLKAQYLLDQGRALTSAGDTADAKKTYGDVLSRFGRLDQAAEARVRLAEIGGTVPPPPPPAVDTTS